MEARDRLSPPDELMHAVSGEPASAVTDAGTALDTRAALGRLHLSSSIYTAPLAAEALLDAVGWHRECDLVGFRLLEPACGDGAILVPAARRLFASAREHTSECDLEHLAGCIAAYEIDWGSVEMARSRVIATLVAEGARRSLAVKLARRWIRCGDFLLEELDSGFTHAVANPPYLRWTRLAADLRKSYEAELPRHAARGDVSLAFLQRSLDLLKAGGKCAFLFPDRWLRSKYGEAFRHRMAERVSLVAHIEAHELPVFDGARKVLTYPAISVFKVGAAGGRDSEFHRPADISALAARCSYVGAIRARTATIIPLPATTPLRRLGGAILWNREAQTVVTDLSERFPTLREVGVEVRCGLGLGVAEAFILSDPDSVEEERRLPFVRTQDIGAGGEIAPSAWLANPWTPEGTLVDLERFPLLASRLGAYRKALEARYCVRRPGEWYRTIDKVRPEAVVADKLIVAGLADRARIGLARSPCQPSNALYTLRSEAWPLSALSRLLRAGALDLFARVLATRVRSGVKRYDGYLLGQVRVPRWDELTSDQRKLLSDTDSDDVDVVAGIYGLDRAAVTGCLADASCDVTPSGGATAA